MIAQTRRAALAHYDHRAQKMGAWVVIIAGWYKAAMTADLKCFLGRCGTRRLAEQAVSARPEALVHYLRWLANGSDNRAPAKPATLARLIASIARVHRILGFGEKQPLPTQAGKVRDTLKGLHREKRHR